MRLLYIFQISLKQVFTTKSFGDHSMVFIYDFYPGAETLMSKHFNNSAQLNAFADPFRYKYVTYFAVTRVFYVRIESK